MSDLPAVRKVNPETNQAAITVLLIDGNAKDRLYYTQRLQKSSPDYCILEGSNGQSGLNICRSNAIDCVVLELDLPDMSGFQVLVNLVPVARTPEITVIVLTRFPYKSLLDAVKMIGAQAAFQKEHTTGDLLDKTILKAISTLNRDREKAKPATLPIGSNT
ncbi:MAG TPA: response regulator [Nitrospira sp.]